MKVQLSDEIVYNIVYDKNKFLPDSIPVVFLHGFSGSAEDWRFLFDELPPRFTPIAIDLLGHGESSSPENIEEYYFLSLNSHLKNIFNRLKISNPILAGYSMGGRAALSFTFANPKIIKALILESSTAGIVDYEDRFARQEKDEQLADKIELFGIEKFVEHWMNIPLFESLKKLPEDRYAEITTRKLKNNRIGLSNSLRGFGTGVMPPLWYELKNISQKVLLISGGKDKKFSDINVRMRQDMPDAALNIVEGAGHNVHLEKPEEFINLVNYFLAQLDED